MGIDLTPVCNHFRLFFCILHLQILPVGFDNFPVQLFDIIQHLVHLMGHFPDFILLQHLNTLMGILRKARHKCRLA